MNTRDQERFEAEILRQLESLYNREDIEIAVHCVRFLYPMKGLHMKYRKKSEIIEAYRFHAGPGPHAWPEGWLDAPHSIIGDGHCRIWDETRQVNLDAEDGSWIIKYKDGFHVTSDKAFQQIYEPAE